MPSDPQLPLRCLCGSPELYRRGRCEPCYNGGRRSRARFGGVRKRVLGRHHYLCRVCHARLHRLRAIDRWVPDLLENLWAEQHPGSPSQLQLPADFLRLATSAGAPKSAPEKTWPL